MSKSVKTLLGLCLALGLLLAALAGAAKPPAPPPTTCPTCPIVYSLVDSGPSERADLMLMQADGSGKTLLLAGADGIAHEHPAWSPDGEWIAFTSNLDGASGLWLIRKDGSELQKVVSAAWRAKPRWQAGPGPVYWLAYVGDAPDGAEPPQVYAVRVEPGATPVASEKTCLTCAWSEAGDGWTDVAFTGDGLHLSALKWAETGDSIERIGLFLFDFVGAAPAAIVNPRFIDHAAFGMACPMGGNHLAWSHAGSTLIAKESMSYDFWSIVTDHDSDPLVSASVNLTGSGYGDCLFYYPSWSPDDSRIVYVARCGKSWGIFVAPVTLPFVHPAAPIATSNSRSQATAPDWKPVP